MARNANMTQSQVQWPKRLWKTVRKAAIDAGVPASEYVRTAVREKLRRDHGIETSEDDSAAESIRTSA